MGNYISFQTLFFENGEIPLSDGEYRGYCLYCGDLITEMVIIHQYKKYQVEFFRLKGVYWPSSFYCKFKIKNGTIVTYTDKVPYTHKYRLWKYHVPCRDKINKNVIYSTIDGKGVIGTLWAPRCFSTLDSSFEIESLIIEEIEN